MVRDLLNPGSGILELREDSNGEVNVSGLLEVRTTSTAEIMGLLRVGNQRRTSEPTAANKTSSRSHAVLRVSFFVTNDWIITCIHACTCTCVAIKITNSILVLHVHDVVHKHTHCSQE